MNEVDRTPVFIGLFGDFELFVNGQRIETLRSAKGQALLSILALSFGRSVQRDKLCALLWPDSTPESGRTNLRQTLTKIRKSFGSNETALLTEGREVSLCAQQVSVDTNEFEKLFPSEEIPSLEAANSLYRGELMESLPLEDSPLFENIHNARRRFQELEIEVLHRLIAHYAQKGTCTALQTTAEKLLRIDPTDEVAHRGLMVFYSKEGRNNAALRQFRSLEKLLKEQLGASPSTESRELYRAIKQTDNVAAIDSETPVMEMENKEEVNSDPYLQSDSRFTITYTWLGVCISLLVFGTLIVKNLSTSSVEKAAPSVMVSTVPVNESRAKHSIAVLPFKNLSADPEQRYFSDGLSEDLITDLSRIGNLNVVARASSFLYQSEDMPLDQIARELGVQHLLLGSVRKQGNQLRINVQLVDASNGVNLWSNRYDRDFADVFVVQDEIARIVVGELAVSLTDAEQARFDSRPAIDPDAYDLLLQALGPLRHLTRESTLEARLLLQRAIDLDPNYARAHANLALTRSQDLIFHFTDDPETALRLGFESINQAVALDKDLPQVQFALAGLHLSANDHQAAIRAARHAIRSDPNYADGHGTLAQMLMFVGKLDEAMESINEAKRINPGFTFTYLWVEGQIHFLRQDFQAASRVFNNINSRNPSFVSGRLLLLSALGHLQDHQAAEWEIAELLTMTADYRISADTFYTRYLHTEHQNLYINGLKLAGLPQ
ncbi:MAG: hypothetical protein KTR35_00710 [Gammaproteobacteria bacterium]|nr:hypothetical protein [Gammaproteobacteria bacterium]